MEVVAIVNIMSSLAPQRLTGLGGRVAATAAPSSTRSAMSFVVSLVVVVVVAVAGRPQAQRTQEARRAPEENARRVKKK